mmetsp:Transcript_34679/g.33023  ORF Transcript_34679/g.33023 Transcript_34679/m.33023 type:complete len:204 (+) Transcript_34679:100-711(+)
MEWRCQECEFDNHPALNLCEICNASHSPPPIRLVTQPITVHITCLSCSYDNDLNAFECAICEQSLLRDSSSSNQGPHRQNTQSTEGLIELVSKCLEKIQKEEKVIRSGPNQGTFLKSEHALCCPFDFMSQRNAEGSEWSCGFRNIQNICGALIKESDEYKNKLFNKDGEIPDVYGIQSWIEQAWKSGYEVLTSGSVHVNAQLY